MAWTLLLWLTEQLYQIDFVKLSLVPLKSGAGALGGMILKRIWRRIRNNRMATNNSLSCMVPDCTGFKGNGMRGMCTKCYGKAKKKVEANETTWEELAEMGLCENQDDPFVQAFNKAKENKS